MSFLATGFSEDELLAIGQRKAKMPIAMSATDINAPIPFEIGRQLSASMQGFSEEQLKDYAMRGAPVPPMRPTQINQPALNFGEAAQDLLSRMGKFLGVRLS